MTQHAPTTTERPTVLTLAQPITDDIADTASMLSTQLCRLTDEVLEDACLSLISAPDAWDCLVLPMRVEDGFLMVAVAEETFDEARALLDATVDMPVRYLRANTHLLEQFIAERYQYEGLALED